jgi:hypothetical protein
MRFHSTRWQGRQHTAESGSQIKDRRRRRPAARVIATLGAAPPDKSRPVWFALTLGPMREDDHTQSRIGEGGHEMARLDVRMDARWAGTTEDYTSVAVLVAVSVTDHDGAPVTGLLRGAFRARYQFDPESSVPAGPVRLS